MQEIKNTQVKPLAIPTKFYESLSKSFEQSDGPLGPAKEFQPRECQSFVQKVVSSLSEAPKAYHSLNWYPLNPKPSYHPEMKGPEATVV